ncbi:hypothetical protein NOVOSPHI9U_420454 [Novosphingobium sp. 9U]|nr:hypothetical protein NOVOSPHI9U_420454 [Novosphingobium sp. 9U]
MRRYNNWQSRVCQIHGLSLLLQASRQPVRFNSHPVAARTRLSHNPACVGSGSGRRSSFLPASEAKRPLRVRPPGSGRAMPAGTRNW